MNGAFPIRTGHEAFHTRVCGDEEVLCWMKVRIHSVASSVASPQLNHLNEAIDYIGSS